MKNTGTLEVTTPTDREIVLTRVFDAPRHLVFEAFTRPELLKRWFGPRGWSLVVCEVDLRVGGGFRFVLRGPDGRDMGMRGVYRELVPPERSVHMESFDDYPGESQVTAVFTEQAGKTTLTATVLYPSQEVRDIVIRTGMEHGAAESYDRLAELFGLMTAPGSRSLTITTPTDREVVLTRFFDAPRHLVFDALTRPELLRRWLTAPGRTLEVCETDMRVGGAFRWVWRGPGRKDVGMRGVYREIVPGERIVRTESWEDWDAGETLVTTWLVEQGVKTTLHSRVLFPSREVRDEVLQSGLQRGAGENYDKLAELLASATE